MKTKHTDGKWFINEGDAPNDLFIRVNNDGEGYDIASLLCDETGDYKANAKLIASAPELLQALQMLINDIERNDGDAINRATLVNEAKQVIDKATK